MAEMDFSLQTKHKTQNFGSVKFTVFKSKLFQGQSDSTHETLPTNMGCLQNHLAKIFPSWSLQWLLHLKHMGITALQCCFSRVLKMPWHSPTAQSLCVSADHGGSGALQHQPCRLFERCKFSVRLGGSLRFHPADWVEKSDHSLIQHGNNTLLKTRERLKCKVFNLGLGRRYCTENSRTSSPTSDTEAFL